MFKAFYTDTSQKIPMMMMMMTHVLSSSLR